MNLIAFALCSIPNIAAARALYDTAGLDDSAVAKILYHRRKQETGREALRPDQQRIAVLSVVCGEPDHPRLETLSVNSDDESGILRHLGESLGGTGRLAGWRLQGELAVLRLRAVGLGVAIPRLWQDDPLDLAEVWGGQTSLDEAGRLMGLPAIGDHQCADVWEAWHAGNHEQVQACAELRALDTWLLAHKLAVAQGRMTPSSAKAGMQTLKKKLADTGAAHLQAYAAALEP
jgi:predicted PolB exonuclease-like 3'-5' exonuclease